ncbi:MAG: glycoside hydrolase family 28 protein [Candidatus Ancillula sp.]|nr:glycoside hydrolase family 28 protein [Candidatus Ancillula sp.]
MNIQDAINNVKENGGGEVIIPAGEHMTGPLELCSNLILTLEDGAHIKFDTGPNAYPPVWTRWEGIECWAMHPLVWGNEVANVIIRGKGMPWKSGDDQKIRDDARGIIDGQGDAWWEKFRVIEKIEDRHSPKMDYELRLAELNPDYKTRPGGGARPDTQFLRPPLMQFFKSKNITIQGFTLQNSPFWTFHTVYSEDIKILDMKILNPEDAINTDAIDIDSSSNVTIENSLLDIGDDAVTLKSGSGEQGLKIGIPTQDVRVSNCKIFASHGGIAIGSETAGGIANVDVNSCEFEGTQRAIRLKSRRTRGGVIENITISNAKMDKCWSAIVLSQYFYPGVLPFEEDFIMSTSAQELSETTPRIKNVVIENVTATNLRSSAAFIVGLPEAPIENVSVKNFQWSLADKEELMETCNSEVTNGLFHDDDRGIKIINAINVSVE